MDLLDPPPAFHSAEVQVFLVGVVCFCAPGMYNTVYSISGGIADQALSSAATALLYLVFALASFAAPAVCNRLGPTRALAAGALLYAPYVLALWALSLIHI